MKIIEPSVKEIIQEPGLEGIYKQIAYGGRICYKSEKIDGHKEFVDMLIARGHGSPLEHGTIYLKIDYLGKYSRDAFEIAAYFHANPFSKVDKIGNFIYITTNYRCIQEAPDEIKEIWQQYLCEPTKYHERRRTFHITCSRGIMDEFVRHRSMSFSCESSRYCNYSKDRFGNELTFVKPYWADFNKTSIDWNLTLQQEDPISQGLIAKTENIPWSSEDLLFTELLSNESCYLELINRGCKPQEAREALPLSIKSEFVMSGFESGWENFFKLRCDKAAHPDAQLVANMIKELM